MSTVRSLVHYMYAAPILFYVSLQVFSLHLALKDLESKWLKFKFLELAMCCQKLRGYFSRWGEYICHKFCCGARIMHCDITHRLSSSNIAVKFSIQIPKTPINEYCDRPLFSANFSCPQGVWLSETWVSQKAVSSWIRNKLQAALRRKKSCLWNKWPLITYGCPCRICCLGHSDSVKIKFSERKLHYCVRCLLLSVQNLTS